MACLPAAMVGKVMQRWKLIERLHYVGDAPWVYYELAGEILGDYPDDGKPRIIDIIKAIRYQFNLGLIEARLIWNARDIEC
jgi:hypothetical protein